MTKAERIERYGFEWYEQYKVRKNIRRKERYHNDPKFREKEKNRSKKRYQYDSEFRESIKAHCKERYQNDSEFRELVKTRSKKRYRNDPKLREYMREYQQNDQNLNGKTKSNIRAHSRYILFEKRKHTRLKDYEIHHCFGYDNTAKFIYIPRALHIEIHQFLRDNDIDADSYHYNSIAQLINSCQEYTYISV